MFKILVILGIVLAAQNSIPGNGSKQEQHPQTHGEQGNKATPTAPPYTSNPYSDKANTDAHSKSNAKEYLKAAFAPANLSNWVLAGLGIIGSGVAIGTLWQINRQVSVMEKQSAHMERQTTVLEKTVAVAQKSAEAFVNTERARLDVSLKQTSPWVFEFTAKNTGRSPAYINYAFIWVAFLEPGTELPEIPRYLVEDEEWLGDLEWVLPNKSTPLRINDILEALDLSGRTLFVSEARHEAIADGSIKIWVYGYIRYRDSVSGNDKFTRFCYSGYPIDDQLEFFRGGPPAYNLET